MESIKQLNTPPRCLANGSNAPDPFCQALKTILYFEGGLNSDPLDKGNPGGTSTNYGITQATYDSFRQRQGLPLRPTTEIRSEEVEQIYFHDYWQASGASELKQPLALIHFDTAVNMGVSRAKAMLRDSLKNLPQEPKLELAEKYLELRESFYHRIAEKGSNSRFLKGWLNRVKHLQKLLTY